MKIQDTRSEYLLKLIKKRAEEFGYAPKLKRVIDRFLAISEISYRKVENHAEHVAILAKRVARKLGKDERLAFAAGLLHDIGKLSVKSELFDGMDIDPVEYARVKRHAMVGFLELKEVDLELALIVGMHHAVYEGGYGVFERDIPPGFPPEKRAEIVAMANIVSVCDFIDADLTRLTTPMDGQAREKSGTLVAVWNKYPGRTELILAAIEEAEQLYEVRLGE